MLDKRQQTSCGERRPPDDEQLRYAAVDAEVLVRLYEHFRAGTSAE